MCAGSAAATGAVECKETMCEQYTLCWMRVKATAIMAIVLLGLCIVKHAAATHMVLMSCATFLCA
jgi:GH15 family glucan-1,4-alpha-glucosidase